MWCIPPKQNAEFVAHMEDVLEVYSRPYNEKRPVICMDEKPFQLLDEMLSPIPMSENNHSKKYDCEYVRKGSCSIFMFTEPYYIAEYGRWDDLLSLMGTPCEKDALRVIKQQLEADLNSMDMGDDVSLLAKWLPSVNASNAQTVLHAKRIARCLGMSDARYRKTLVNLRERIRIIENSLRVKDYSFDYSKQPSKAMFKYRKAFYRNDGERYEAFLSKVSRGEAQLHTGTLTPYEIIKPFFYDKVSDQEANAIDATWRAQEDFTGDENALVVIDGSGSMYCRTDPMPATVALSLGIYFAERNTGAFRNHFITFSEKPQLVEIKGETILDKVRYCHGFNEVANTNIQKVFELILRTAVKNKVPQAEMPSTL